MMPNVPPQRSNMAFVDGTADAAEVNINLNVGTAVPSSLFGKVQQYYAYAVNGARRQLAMVRPWKEFFDRQCFLPPSGLSESLSRLNRNINYYYHNYMIMAILCSSYVLLLNPAFSFCVALTLAMWWFVGTKRVEGAETNINHFIVLNRKITFSQAYLFIAIFAGISFFLTNGSSVMFWLVLSSVGVVVVHAVLRKPQVEEQPFSFV
ncbi:hypothetical protein MOQ_008634 [Trypanosoma cruzi marinkellei]|uniref:PRA1 family protein n=1 Tax=Trypanosoma cruzi marinkellei TaxID=85056 RepID=K2MKG5_TRYCR|nr:hypothetical protein MOQ_008634 [Trypanosoma cruzi marinkellei]